MKLKRVLSMALCVLMLVSLLPVGALAADSFTVDGLTYSVNNNGTSVTLTDADASRSGEITVPETVTNGAKSYAVTKIGARAFYQKTKITGVTLPESVTSIGEAAFAESGLTSFTFPTGVTEVPDDCFSDCASLSSVTLAPDTTTIGIEAFARTPALTELELPAALEYIRMDAFLPQDRAQPILTLYYMGTSIGWKNVIQYTDAEDVATLQPADAASLYVADIICHDAHDFSNGGVCTCGKSVAASITLADGSTTTYYDTLSAAFAAVSTASSEYSYDGCTVTLLRSVSEAGLTLSGGWVNCTLDLGGCTLTDPNSTGLSIHTGAAVTIRNGTITANNSGGVKASSGAQVTLSGVTSPTIEVNDAATVVTVGSGVSVTSHMRMHGGTMQMNAAPSITGFTDGAQFVFKEGVVKTNIDLGSTVYKVRGGSDATYPLPFARGGDGITLDPQSFSSAAEGYYVGRNADGGISLFEGSCSHAETDNDGHCDVCGVPFAAKVTVGTANPVYCTKMSTALSQWSQQTEQTTLTLLYDGVYDSTSPLGLSGNHILDLNGCTLTMKGQGTIQLDTNAELCMQDSSSAQDGRYKGRITLVGDNTSFTLDSGHINYSESAVMVSDNNEKSRQITVNGGSITSSKYCIDGNGHYTKIQINGGTLSSPGGSSAIRLGIVTLKEPATVYMASSDANVIAVYRLAIEGTPNIRGRLYYSSDTELVDLSGYTGDGLEIRFDLTDGVYQKGDESIKLPANYGLFDANDVEITEIARGVAAVKPIHVHSWSFSAEGAVITAVCSGSVGICPVEGRTATVTLAASDANPTYNGAGYPCSAVHSVPGLFNVSDGDIVYSTEGNTVPVNAGSYTASLSCGGATATLSYEIKPATMGLWSISPIADQTYTGSAITPAVEVSGGSEGTDYTVTYENNVHAGTARVIVTGKGNYSGSLESSFVIKPAAIQITATLAKDSYAYTGSPIEPEITVTTDFGGTAMNLARDMDYKLSGESKTEAGSVVTVKVEAIPGGNFVFEPVTLQYRIVQAEPACQAPGGFTATYGQHLFMLSLPEAENGTWSWRAPTASVGAVGDQIHSAVFTPTDTANYKAVYVDVTVKVNPAVLTVTGVNIANKVYDGSDQMTVSSLVINGRVGSDDVTVAGLSTLKATAPSANAGAYTEVTLPVLSLSGAAAGNYTLTQPGKISASYAIGPKAVTPTVAVAAGSYVYNGKAHTPAVTLKDGSAVIPASEYTVRYDCNINAGTGRAYISDNTGGNYTVAQAEGTFTIQKAVITITADNKTATVGQTAPTPTYSTAGVVSGETFRVLPIVAYVSNPDMSKAGTAVIRAGGAVAPSDNYSIQYVDGTLTVKAASGTGGGTGSYGGNVAVTVDMSDVKLESKTYDGKPLSYSGKASARYYYGDFTYTWYTANGYRLSEAPTDAGDYVLRATVSRSGYAGYASKKVSILKAQLIISADDLKAEVGDELPELSYSVKGLAAGDKLKTEPKLSFETEPDMSKAGNTPILVSGAAVPDSKNYETAIKYIEGTLTVDDAEAETEEASGDTEPATEPEELLKLEVSVGEENKALDKKLGSKESAFYDLALQRSEDGGQSWNASTEQLPEGGVKVSLPLPEGSDENCSFRVIHDGGEYPVTVTKHEDGKYYLDFTAAKLGSVAVGWTAPGREGGFPWWILLAALGLTGAAGGGYAFWRKRRKNRE